jgi:hypothetical protein
MRVIDFYSAHARRVAAALAGVAALSVFLYGALLLGAVAHATGRTAAEKQLRSLSSSVSALESTFLAETRGLSPERAAAMGFVAPVAVDTVYAGTSGLTLR